MMKDMGFYKMYLPARRLKNPCEFQKKYNLKILVYSYIQRIKRIMCSESFRKLRKK